ncbi:LLM class flavin-dependent oxidoreductase [Fodinicola acaciae]|uniref:LLM class flavin-dependent oxidoreductase n=1 Tax=Fodinicola acaciae TaxID=2681555 RepID=UPI0013D23414|nr:LLM class flavin-dependent oxidoreductase [Fodinicola acaciae]
MQIGIMLPSRETAMTGRHDAAGLVRFARRAEEAGLDSVWTGESVLARTRVEPLSLLSAVAGATSRVCLGTAALIGPLRHHLALASQAATVDQLSGGRLILGLGAGAPMPESRGEFEALGVPFAGRTSRLDDLVDQCRQWWRGGDALPAVQPGGPPLWLAGGDSPRVIARVASHFDGWLPYMPDAGAYARAWKEISSQTEENGRMVTPGLYATLVIADRANDVLDAYARAYYRQPLSVMNQLQAYHGGSAASCLDWLGHYVEAGARHLILRIGSVDADEQLDLIGERLLPDLRSMSRRIP